MASVVVTSGYGESATTTTSVAHRNGIMVATADERTSVNEPYGTIDVYTDPSLSSGCHGNLSARASDAAIAVECRPVLLDIQLIQTTHGYLIKELAYKTPLRSGSDGHMWPSLDRGLRYACYRHDPADVPLHRTIRVNGKICDRYTGLVIDCGEHYSDGHVLSELRHCNPILLKGHNKKRVLVELFARNAGDGTFREIPTIINVDSATRDEEDVAFCQQHLAGPGADFSFKFVYRRFPVYLKLASCRDGNTPSDLPIYVNNAIAVDRRYDTLALGRPLWICPHDHSCGEISFTTQRCAALNVGLLETLWFLKRDTDYRQLLSADNRGEHATRSGNRFRFYDRARTNGYAYNRQASGSPWANGICRY